MTIKHTLNSPSPKWPLPMHFRIVMFLVGIMFSAKDPFEVFSESFCQEQMVTSSVLRHDRCTCRADRWHVSSIAIESVFICWRFLLPNECIEKQQHECNDNDDTCNYYSRYQRHFSVRFRRCFHSSCNDCFNARVRRRCNDVKLCKFKSYLTH